MSDDRLFRLKVDLTLAQASRILDEALRAAREHALLPLAVAVRDAGGNLVAFKREDGAGIVRMDIAVGKAWGALGMGIPSRTIRDRLGNRPAFQGAVAAASGGRFVPVPGGVLALDAGRAVVGAVGISGDTSDKDEYCAITGIRAAGLTPAPADPAENWQASGL